ncbi:hypothetical protein GCM10020369_69630 [Cryptosporangium minutisporangium]|uniref:MEDS domain-containing protein n=1 Tax=Cryptosporangium minutisporangium TaxID=113569 RepID=A0ABP6T8A3_9ACTN
MTLAGAPLHSGDHLCVFYRGREERDRVLLPFLMEGLRSGHAVLVLGRVGERTTLRTTLGDWSHLEIVEPENGHLRDGRYAPAELLLMLDEWADRNLQANGSPPSAPSSFGRIAADMSWAQALMSPVLVDQLVGEEVEVTQWLCRYPQVALCLYDLELFGGDLIIPMVRAHPKVWMAGTLIENPYYLKT